MALAVQKPPISAAEALAVLRSSSEQAGTGRRNRALNRLPWRAGLRPGEALAPRPGDVDLDRRALTVGDRVAGLDDPVAAELGGWIDRRAESALTGDGPFTPALQGKPLSPAHVRELLPGLGSCAGLAGRVHAMGLRYACAAEMAGEGIPTEIIESQLGIRPQSSVARYLTIADDADVVAAMAARPIPRG